jgi:hypothetical protein
LGETSDSSKQVHLFCAIAINIANNETSKTFTTTVTYSFKQKQVKYLKMKRLSKSKWKKTGKNVLPMFNRRFTSDVQGKLEPRPIQ